MNKLMFQLRVPVSRLELYDWHAREGAFERLCAPWDDIRHVHADPLANGSTRVFDVIKAGIPIRWVATHEDVVPGEQFVDVQSRGPFAYWKHTHRFEAVDQESSLLVDDISYQLPLGAVGAAIAGGSIRRDVERMFAFRHRATLGDLSQHARVGRTFNIGITGASGLIGRQLVAFLRTGGHKVMRFVRHTEDTPAADEIRWSTQEGVRDLDRMEGLDAVVHLAGATVAQRWSPEVRRQIMDSRVLGTRAIVEAIAQLADPPEVLLSASAVGFYGDTAQSVGDENTGPGEGFLAEVCQAWEAEARRAQAFCRTVIARIGVVVDPRGGALQKLLPVTLSGAGGPVGSGRQWVSWVGLDDVLGAILTLVDNRQANGAYNLTGPEPVQQVEMARTLGKVVSRPAFVPAPAAAIRLLYGDMGEATVLASTGVRPQRLVDLGYKFRTPTLEAALRHCLGHVGPPQ